MNKKNIILHLGWHKTATTSLQHIFSHTNNILYLGRPYEKEIFEFMAYLAYTNELFFDQKKFVKKFQEYVDKHDEKLVLISDEHFTPISVSSPIVFERIGKCFPEGKIILTIRNQADALKSLYIHKFHEKRFFSNDHFNQWLEKGLDEDWQKDFQPNHRINDQGAYINAIAYDYWKSIELMKRVFGKDKISIFLFEDYVKDYSSMIKSLFDTLGLDHQHIPFENPPELNTNSSKKSKIIPRHWKRKIENQKKLGNNKLLSLLSRSILKAVDGYEANISRAKLKKQQLSISPEVHETLIAFYKSSNERMSQEFSLDLADKGYFD